jgi:transcriptional regulator with XRE-family HTH domain
MKTRETSYLYRDIGHRIADLRRERARARTKRLTQREVAEALEVAEGTVTAWETGKQRPEGENLLGLARLLRTSPAYLLTGEESRQAATAGDDASGQKEPFELLGILTESGALRLLGDIAPAGEASDIKADQLQLIRRVAKRRGRELPGWWYDLLRRVDAGEL